MADIHHSMRTIRKKKMKKEKAVLSEINWAVPEARRNQWIVVIVSQQQKHPLHQWHQQPLPPNPALYR